MPLLRAFRPPRRLTLTIEGMWTPARPLTGRRKGPRPRCPKSHRGFLARRGLPVASWKRQRHPQGKIPVRHGSTSGAAPQAEIVARGCWKPPFAPSHGPNHAVGRHVAVACVPLHSNPGILSAERRRSVPWTVDGSPLAPLRGNPVWHLITITVRQLEDYSAS